MIEELKELRLKIHLDSIPSVVHGVSLSEEIGIDIKLVVPSNSLNKYKYLKIIQTKYDLVLKSYEVADAELSTTSGFEFLERVRNWRLTLEYNQIVSYGKLLLK